MSHSSQFSRVHACPCAATNSNNSSTPSLRPIRKRYILQSNSVRIHSEWEEAGTPLRHTKLFRASLFPHICMVICRLIKELEMKREVLDPITLQVKSLSKSYRNISRDNIRILHEFCQFDYRRTNRVVCVANDMKNPISIIEAIIKKPGLSEEMLADLERKYLKQYGQEVEAEQGVEKEEEVIEQVKQVGPGYNLFEAVPSDCILRIMEFLDPYSFVAFSRSCQRHHKVGQSQALGDYYKSLCVKVFRAGPVALPNECRFGCIRAYVEQHPNQYGPNTRNAVANNLRRWVWRMEVGEVACEASFLKSFGSYQALFLRCPRIHFNGYYVCRQKYVRIGQKNEKYPVAPIHVVYYYRYFRFMPDGSVLYHVRGKRMKQNVQLAFLSKAYLNGQHPQTMVGEFLQDRDRLFVKAVRNNTVFTYELQIRSQEGRISNELKIHRYTLELVDDHQDIKQVLYLAKPDHEDKVFQYSHSTILAEENPPAVTAASL